jgi:hypothetical protein
MTFKDDCFSASRYMYVYYMRTYACMYMYIYILHAYICMHVQVQYVLLQEESSNTCAKAERLPPGLVAGVSLAGWIKIAWAWDTMTLGLLLALQETWHHVCSPWRSRGFVVGEIKLAWAWAVSFHTVPYVLWPLPLSVGGGAWLLSFLCLALIRGQGDRLTKVGLACLK